MRKQAGFSLIELLIVVAIILAVAAIAIPNLLRSRIASSEASAVHSIRTLNTAEVTFSALNPQCGYATLPTLVAAQMVADDSLAAGVKAGYSFTVNVSGGTANCTPTSTPNSILSIAGDPQTFPDARHFLSDGASIHHRTGGPAQFTDPTIQ